MDLKAWPPAWQAIWLLAVDPQGLGGLCLRGRPGPVRDRLLSGLQQVLPAGTPWRRLPLRVDDVRLLGGVDLGLSLAAGRPVVQRGLLAEAAAGVLVLPMAERADSGLAARLAAALEPGALHDRLCVVALDESMAPDESVSGPLQERLGLMVTLDAAPPTWPLPDVAAARQRHGAVQWDRDVVQALCATAAALGIESLRAVWQAWCAARAAAALEGREAVTQTDAELAARLVLAPRARALPPQAEDDPSPEAASKPPGGRLADKPADPPADLPSDLPSATPDHAPEPSPDSSTQALAETVARTGDGSDPAEPSAAQALQDQTLAAARAAMPPGLLERLAAGTASPGGARGRQGPATREATSGRPLPARRGTPGTGRRLDLLATLRAALPWQRLRQHERVRQGLPPAATRLLLRRDDFHVRRQCQPQETTTIFVVDASGSQALHRLAEAKGAVELLLADCYVRRDRVALIAFRGSGAELLLPPTRSLARARRSLASLPGGGGTPLAAGIDAAWQLGRSVQARCGGRVVLVFLTDARANVARDGRHGRAQATDDALAAAQRLRVDELRSLLIDTSARPDPAALTLAQALGARYVPLPHGQAAAVHAAVSAAV